MKATPNLGRILGFVVFALVASAPPARAQSWVATGGMSVQRFGHTATLLNDGRVLAAGGWVSDYAVTPTAELYDPGTGTWTLTGSMSMQRGSHTATLLTDGRVLVAGGSVSDGTATATAELFDPATGAWIAIGSMSYARERHTAVLLTNGRVLVAGGDAGGTAELFDPAAGAWTLTGSLNYARWSQTATLLIDGRVLVAGGITAGLTAELFDRATGAWTLTGSMSDGAAGHTATLLNDGTVLVAGAGGNDRTAEVYEPTMGTWRGTGAMADGRDGHTATLLANGHVLVAGGFGGCWPNGWGTGTPQLSSAEDYDPAAGIWGVTPSMGSGRYLHTATPLPDGKVLVAGGVAEWVPVYDEQGFWTFRCDVVVTAAAEIYQGFADTEPPPPDTTAPETSIVSAVDANGAAMPDGGVTLSNAITFTFSATDNVAVLGYECQLDNAGFIPCTNPVTYSGLALGRHGFEVRAVDSSNNRDTTPAPYTWTVDAPPETTITSVVDRQGNPIPNGGFTRSSQITFSFTGTNNVSVTGFECSLDGAAFTPCTSPITYERVRSGTHTFQVRAIDNNGFLDPTPAAFTWTRR